MSVPRFDAWALPRGAPPAAAPMRLPDTEPLEIHVPGADAVWVGRLARGLAATAAALRERPVADVVRALGAVGRRFLSEGDPIRSLALELLPATSGLSREMASAVLDGMARDWSEERISLLLRTDLGDPAVLDGFVEGSGGWVRALGPDLCVQIVSGSVPGVGATALLRSLAVKAPTLLKPGLGDIVLPVLFARALREEDALLGEAAAVVYWKGGSGPLEDAALAEAEVVIAYGGDEAVRTLRARTPATARFVAYHHRVSVGVIGRAALAPGKLHRTASEVAGAVSFFDQRGCVSPQAIYVEEGGAATPAALAREIAEALTRLEHNLPGGALQAAEASALQQLRGTAEMLAASPGGTELHHGGRASWTVVLDTGDALRPACVGRVVRVVPVRDAREVVGRLAPLRAHLQTVGVAGIAGARLVELAEALARQGASRIAPFADVPFPPPWWHHDGQGPLRALVRWVDLA